MDKVEAHYISQINRAIAGGREELVDELVALQEVEAASSTSLGALRKRAARHAKREH
jgi:hypothetical protein